VAYFELFLLKSQQCYNCYDAGSIITQIIGFQALQKFQLSIQTRGVELIVYGSAHHICTKAKCANSPITKRPHMLATNAKLLGADFADACCKVSLDALPNPS
jgi:hypothetical protein